MEMIIILALIAIIMAIAFPSFQRYSANENLRTAARDFMADFAAAKGRAAAENINFSISFNVGSNQYTITSSAETETKSFVPFGVRIQNLIPGGSIITIQTRGTIDPEGELTLDNSRGSTAKINWNIAGRTYVEFDMR